MSLRCQPDAIQSDSITGETAEEYLCFFRTAVKVRRALCGIFVGELQIDILWRRAFWLLSITNIPRCTPFLLRVSLGGESSSEIFGGRNPGTVALCIYGRM